MRRDGSWRVEGSMAPYIGETMPCPRELTNGHNPFSSVTHLLAASIQENGICNERRPVGLGKIAFEGLDFLK